MPIRRASFRLLALVAPVAAVAVSAGCYSTSGPWWSGNAPLTYASTSHAPKTVSLIDTRTQEVLWSVDVPVNKQVVVKFRDDVNEGDVMSSVMMWEIMPAGNMFGSLDNSMPVPPANSRRIEMTLRPTELPEPSLSQAN